MTQEQEPVRKLSEVAQAAFCSCWGWDKNSLITKNQIDFITKKLSAKDQKDFLLKEYESLRKELEFLSKDLRSLERYVIISISGVWGFLLTQSHSQPDPNVDYIRFLKLAWRGLPIIFSSCGIVRAASLYMGINKISEYLRWVEKKLELAGWETYNNGIPWQFAASLILIWSAILLAAIFSPSPLDHEWLDILELWLAKMADVVRSLSATGHG